MKKVVISLCVAAAVFVCSMFAPIAAKAGTDDCSHRFNAEVQVPIVYTRTLSVHQYVVNDEENGADGPVYGTCQIVEDYTVCYLRCTLCGYIDYATPHETRLRIRHTECELRPREN